MENDNRLSNDNEDTVIAEDSIQTSVSLKIGILPAKALDSRGNQSFDYRVALILCVQNNPRFCLDIINPRSPQ